MTCLPQDLRTLIVATTAITDLISTRCHYNHVPESAAKPFVWFRVASDNEDLTLDGTGGLHEALCDLECAADSESAAQGLADAVKATLHGYSGTMGNETAQAAFVSDKDDDYLPYSNQSDEGAHVVAFTLTVWYTT